MAKLKGVFLALAAFGLFALHDVVVKLLGSAYSPVQIIFFSVLLAFPLVTLMLMRDPTSGHLRPVHPWWLALRMLAGVVTGISVFYAFSMLRLAQTYSVLFATPLLITVFSIPVLGERVGIHRWLAVVFGLIGVIVVLRPGTAPLGPGHLAALTAATFSALASIIIRKIGREERAVVLLLYPMVANFAVMAFALPFVYRPMPLGDFGLVGLIAVFGFAAGLLLIGAYTSAEAAIVAPMQYSQIVWAALFGYWMFGETIDPATMAGAAIVIASGLYIVFRESRGATSENTPVLRTRTRFELGAPFRIGFFYRRWSGRK